MKNRADEIRDLALDTLGVLIEGYTAPAFGPQLRLRTCGDDVGRLFISAEEIGEGPRDGARYYTITISVQEQEEG